MTPTTKCEIAFIDRNVDDLHILLAGIRPDVEAILLSNDEPAPRQMARSVQGREGELHAIHVIAHGGPGEVLFGAGALSIEAIGKHGADLAQLGQVLLGGNLFLWSCETGQGECGEGFVDALATATGVEVAAATGLVGAAARGGCWEINVRPGATEARIPLTPAGAATYTAVMANTWQANPVNSSSEDGDWSDSSHWSDGSAPVANDDVTIPTLTPNNPFTVTLDINTTPALDSLTINSNSATLAIGNNTLDVTGTGSGATDLLTVTAGHITIAGGTIDAGAISSHSDIAGYGTISASSFNSTDTVTAVGGTLDFTNSVDSTTATTFNIADNSVLEFDGAVGTSAINPTINFVGPDGAVGMLDLTSLVPNSFHGVIANFTDDEKIEVANATSATLDSTGKILTVSDGSDVLQTIHFSSSYAGDTFNVAGGIITLSEIPLAFTSPASISGTPLKGQVLTAVDGTLNDSDASVTGYQWISSNGNAVLGTDSTYTVQESDVGSTITLVETATDPDGGGQTTSPAAVGPVASTTWQASGLNLGGVWNTTDFSHWSDGSVPAAGDDVLIPTLTPNNPFTVTLAIDTPALDSLTINSNSKTKLAIPKTTTLDVTGTGSGATDLLTVTAGHLVIQGGTIKAGAISSDADITGYGTVSVSSFNSAGTVTAIDGTLDFTNSVDSTTATTFNIANKANSVLEFDGAVGTNETIQFSGPDGAVGELDLMSSVANSFNGVIANFTDDEKIKVANATSATLDSTGKILTVSGSSGVLQTIHFASSYKGDTFNVASDGTDGTITLSEITLALGPPSISGKPQEGQVLTAVSGALNDPGAAVSYQWKNGNAVLGTDSTYTVQESDEGATITLLETATDPDGGSPPTSNSATVGPVTDMPLMFTSPASISGTAQEGQVLTANGTLNDSDASVSYQWISSNGKGNKAVLGTDSTYAVQESDEGSTITLVETATDNDGGPTTTSTSAPVGPVSDIPLQLTNVSISGTPQEGQVLTALIGTLNDTDASVTGYQWMSSKSTVPLGTASTYTVQESDEGSTITLVETATDNDGGGQTTSTAAVGPVTDIPLKFNTAASISGTPQVGYVLTAVNGTLDDSDASVTGYQWMSSKSTVPLGTAQTYTVQQSDVGSTITLVETATDIDGGPTAISPQSAVGPVTAKTANEVADPRSITFTLKGSPNVTVNVVEDGGKLDFTLTTNAPADLSGLYFDLTNTKLSKLADLTGTANITQFVTKAGGVNNLRNGVNLNGLKVSTFDVGMEFGLAGKGANHQNIQSESFVLSDATNTTPSDLSIDDLRPSPTKGYTGPAFGPTGETGTVGVNAGQKLEAVAPYAPTALWTAANPFVVTTAEDTSTNILASSLAYDLNSGAVLTVDKIPTGAQGPQYGSVTINPDGSLTYTATPLDYEVNGILTGNQDSFQVSVKDNFGGTVTSYVEVKATPVTDKPTLDLKVISLPGDPADLYRLQVKVHSGDYNTINAGSDYIQSLALSLTGNLTDGATIKDTNGWLTYNASTGYTITPVSSTGGNLDNAQDEIDITLPTSTLLANPSFSVTDDVTVTATAAETESTPAKPIPTATDTKDQQLAMETAHTTSDLTFTTSGQSIWNTGTAFVEKDFSSGFLGVDKSVSTHGGVTIPGFTIPGFTPFSIPPLVVPPIVLGGGKATAHIRLGVEADLKISSGDLNATLPYEVNLDSLYNKTTDTLEITPSDMLEGGGVFTAHGPTGTFKFGIDLGIKGSAHLTLLSGLKLGTGLTFGSFTKPVYTKGIKSSAKFGGTGFVSSRLPIPTGVGTLTLAFPKVNTDSSTSSLGTSGAGTISGTGTSNNMVNVRGNLVTIINSLVPLLPGISEIHTVGKGKSYLDFISVKAFLSVGLALVQKFNLSSSGLESPDGTVPVLVLGDGGSLGGSANQIVEPFTFGTPLTIPDASSLGIVNPTTGKIDVSLALVPDASLTNNTSLQPNMSVQLTAGKISFGALGIHVGPLTAYKNTFSIPLPTLPAIFNSTFKVAGWNTLTVKQAV